MIYIKNNKKIKYIKKCLIKKNIRDYKIIESNEKIFSYKNIQKKVMCETIVTNKILALFKLNKKMAKFVLSVDTPKNTIKSLINECIENSFNDNSSWHMDIFNKFLTKHDKKYKKYFNNFNIERHLVWLNSEIKKISNKVNFTICSTYKICLNQYKLLTNSDFVEQYYLNSELFCADDTTFQKKAMLNNKFLNENFANSAVRQLKKIIIPNAQKIFDIHQTILIKAKAVAQFLNEYVAIFNANNVYLKHSYIKKTDLGKKIVKSSFSLFSLPYVGMKFDAEGNKISQKQIIKNGKVVNLLSNNFTARCMNIKSFGNSSYNNFEEISHQRLKFMINAKTPVNLPKFTAIIYNFEYIYLDMNKKTFNGIALCSNTNGKYYLAKVNFFAKELFDNMYSAGCKSKWIANVYCQNVIVSF